MSIVLPEGLTEEDHAWAQLRFTEAQAARDLAETPAPATGPAVTSMGEFRLKRYVARRRAIAASGVARAAHSGDQPLQRMIGPYRLDVVDQEDVVFLILNVPAGVEAPKTFQAFDEATASTISLDLPNPISGAIQVVLDPRSDGPTIELLTNLSTEFLVE